MVYASDQPPTPCNNRRGICRLIYWIENSIESYTSAKGAIQSRESFPRIRSEINRDLSIFNSVARLDRESLQSCRDLNTDGSRFELIQNDSSFLFDDFDKFH